MKGNEVNSKVGEAWRSLGEETRQKFNMKAYVNKSLEETYKLDKTKSLSVSRKRTSLKKCRSVTT